MSLSGIEGSEKEEKGRIGPLVAALFFLKKNHQWRRKKKLGLNIIYTVLISYRLRQSNGMKARIRINVPIARARCTRSRDARCFAALVYL